MYGSGILSLLDFFYVFFFKKIELIKSVILDRSTTKTLGFTNQKAHLCVIDPRVERTISR